MQKTDTSEFYADDSRWLDLLNRHLKSTSIEWMHEELGAELAEKTIRTYHGCRTSDAGSYYREGLRVHEREALIEEFRRLVEGDERLRYVRSRFNEVVEPVCSKVDRGRCFVVLDARTLLNGAGHYLIYGSELICSFLDEWQRRVLLERGTPTLLHIDLPLSKVDQSERNYLAGKMLREWARLTVWNDVKDVIELDFTFIFREPLPASYIVGHSHPVSIIDPFSLDRPYRSPRTTCAHCEAKE